MEHRKQARPLNLPDNDAVTSPYERRFVCEKVEYRAAENGMGEVYGYALKWGVPYDMGWYTEIIDRNALRNADLSDIRILDNHESHLVLGRTKSGTATVGMDNTGMWYSATLPDSPNGQNMRASLTRGDIDQSSWGFIIRADENGKIIGDKWELIDGKRVRTILDVAAVVDASPVTFPANPDTSAAKRSHTFAFRDGGEEGMSTPEEQAEPMAVIDEIPAKDPSSTWSIGWMADTVARAIKEGNDMVREINYLVPEYDYYAKADTAESATFQKLLGECIAAKAAVIAMMNAHLDALKEINGFENRSEKDTAPVEKRDEEQKTNTYNPVALEMELDLLEAQSRFKKHAL